MNDRSADASPWPHRLARLLCLLTFPLIWVGGLITTTDAGMAVPDWPGTYGYNLLLYPWQTWFFGPWDLFIEHGHRLLASFIGLLTIVVLVVVYRTESTTRAKRLAALALLLVCFQGVLGGLRVLLNARHLALLHGATGPLFFVVTIFLVAATRTPARERKTGRDWLVTALPWLLYGQLVLGATLRHTPEDSDPWAFALHVQSHLTMAGVVALTAVAVAVREAFAGRRRFAMALGLVLAAQLSLGFGTWIAKYRYPAWADPTSALTAVATDQNIGPPRVRVWAGGIAPGTMRPSTAGGFAETSIVTAHSAIGSLLLGIAVARTAGLWRKRRGNGREPVVATINDTAKCLTESVEKRANREPESALA